MHIDALGVLCAQLSRDLLAIAKFLSFAFSSRYAKTRTSNFREVVRQRTEGVVGSITWILL